MGIVPIDSVLGETNVSFQRSKQHNGHQSIRGHHVVNTNVERMMQLEYKQLHPRLDDGDHRECDLRRFAAEFLTQHATALQQSLAAFATDWMRMGL